MKKGLILYVTEGKEEIYKQEWPEFREQPNSLGTSTICVATSEDEIAYSWWRLLTRGIQHISCMKAAYNATRGKLEPYGTVLRLCG
jgi:hypothetical protein